MELEDVIRSRRMVRAFAPGRAVDPATLDRLLDLAMRVPSAGFTQGTELLVLEGRDETEQFWEVTFAERGRDGFPWPGLFDAPVLVIPWANRDAYLDRYAQPDKGWTDRDPQRWPVPYWYVDAGFSAMVMLLAAVDAGLGALFFLIDGRHVEPLRDRFGVPPHLDPVGAVAIGHPAPDRPSRSVSRGRRPLREVVHRGRWAGA